jgi:hypothetical protein
MGQTRKSPFLDHLPRLFFPALVLACATLASFGAAGPPAVASAAGSSQLLINEILYDATGPDEGGEFVELLLPAESEPLDLGRVSLERGNGSRPGDWREAWHGAAGDTLIPGERFVTGGAQVTPPPRFVIELGLQNGPDACRLLIDGQPVDVVGWGDLAGGEFFAGEPAPDVPAGTSLGRIPDGRNSGNNRADFVPLPAPGPGAPNRRPSRLRLRTPGHRSDAGSPPRLLVDWQLEMDADAPATNVEVCAFPCQSPATRAAVAVAVEGGATRSGTLVLGPLDLGPLELCVTCNRPPHDNGAEELTVDTLRVAARAGPGALRINEFLYRPATGEPEWVELVNAGSESLRTESYSLADGRLDPVELAGAPPLGPGDLLVVAEEALPDGSAALTLGSRWPLLNDSGDPVADRVRVLDEAGRTSDDVGYGGHWAPAALSVERVSVEIASADPAAWSAAPLGPTPGRRNGAAREFTASRGFLQIEPALVSARDAGPVLLRLADPLARGALTVHAMDGRLVRRFGGAALAGRRWLLWDGRDDAGEELPPGLYLVSVAGERVPASMSEGDAAQADGADDIRIQPSAAQARATFVIAP